MLQECIAPQQVLIMCLANVHDAAAETVVRQPLPDQAVVPHWFMMPLHARWNGLKLQVWQVGLFVVPSLSWCSRRSMGLLFHAASCCQACVQSRNAVLIPSAAFLRFCCGQVHARPGSAGCCCVQLIMV